MMLLLLEVVFIKTIRNDISKHIGSRLMTEAGSLCVLRCRFRSPSMKTTSGTQSSPTRRGRILAGSPHPGHLMRLVPPRLAALIAFTSASLAAQAPSSFDFIGTPADPALPAVRRLRRVLSESSPTLALSGLFPVADVHVAAATAENA